VKKIIDEHGRVGIVDQVRDTGVFVHPEGEDHIISRDGSDYMTTTYWTRQEDGSLRGLWFNSAPGAFVTARDSEIGRPRLGSDPRERLNTTVDASTAAAIDADRRAGESRGRVLDRWALAN
jgi:hypothetical protein